ncbi:ABC transporter permease [Streptomyces sp. NL15-2K]|uniref:ABC transporter permease n=1 Tax=Streptomyces sp. NL15-2K TaxID=376149 RepID=UPI000F5675A8|nr:MULTISPECIES: ABC transporter permease [Actinomycetes]WKX14091.1 ABC transporter permease [Kutzneria buriramensis]GCB44758.1 ABC transporter permease protein [Streptomyces sp. NL15-2K]
MTDTATGWGRFVLLRLLGTLVALLALSVVIFAATEILPGDAAGAIAGTGASAEQVAKVRTELGLDQPAAQRYAEWIADAACGDLGTAYLGSRDVSDVLADRIPASLLLVGLVYLLAVPCGVLLGAAAGFGSVGGRRGRSADRMISVLLLGAIGMPEFLLAGLLLSLVAVGLGLVPAVSLVPPGTSPLDVPETLVLPVLTLAVLATAAVARLIRASVADVLATPYIESARLSGVRGWALVIRHVLPNALAPTVQALAVSTGGMIGGTAVVESIFQYPGVGSTLRSAVAARDVPLVQGIALTLCAITLLVLLFADLVTRLLTPAQRTASAGAPS